MADITTRARECARRLSDWWEWDKPSLTRPGVTFWPPPSTTLPIISPSPVGSIDTVKFVMRASCSRRDFEALLQRSDFEVVECDGSRVVRGGTTIRSFGKRIELKRDADGLRIRITDHRIEIEVSLPRVLGLFNDQQDMMTESDVLLAARRVTADLFPATTLRGRFPKPSGKRRYWHITRLDLAVNFWGNVQEYVETYRRALRARSSAEATCYCESGLAFFGKDFELVIYDPSKRQPQGKLRRALLGRRFSNQPGRVRVELRFKNPQAIQRRLLPHVGLDYRGLPFLDSNSEGTEAVHRFGLDHHRLHQILADELTSLGRGRRPTGRAATPQELMRHLAFRQLAQDPGAWAEVRRVFSPRGYRRRRQEFTGFQIETKEIDIVRAAWSRPRKHPSIKKERLVRLQRSVRAQLQRSLSHRPDEVA